MGRVYLLYPFYSRCFMNKKKITFNFYFITIFFVLQMLFVGVILLLDLTFKVNFPFYIFHFIVIAIDFVFFIIFLLWKFGGSENYALLCTNFRTMQEKLKNKAFDRDAIL